MMNHMIKRAVSFLAAAVLTVSNFTPIAPMRAESGGFYPHQEKAGMEQTESETTSDTVVTEQVTSVEPETVDDVSSEETELTYQIIELYPDEEADEKTVTLNGLMPEGAEATAVDVSDEHDGVAAYDITITDGETAYQPGEENPIKVEIVDPVITEDITLWHIHDDGTREQIFDFDVEEGKVSFYATGFSVYEIVDPLQTSAAMDDKIEELGASGIDAFVHFEKNTDSAKQKHKFLPYFFTGEESTYSGQNNRKGLSIIQAAALGTIPSGAKKLYFERIENTNKFYIYFKDNNDNRSYFNMNYTGMYGNMSNNQPVANTYRSALCKGAKTAFQFTEWTDWNGYRTCKVSAVLEDNQNHYWVSYSDSYPSVVGYRSSTDPNIAYLSFPGLDDDPYFLNGKEYGLMYNTGNEAGFALMANRNFNAKLDELVLNNNKTFYVFEDSDITMWRFKNVGEDNYKLFAIVDGVTQYLKLQSDETSLAITENENEAQVFKVNPTNNGTVKLSCVVGDGDSAVTKYMKCTEPVIDPQDGSITNLDQIKFDMSGTASDATELNFVKIADGNSGNSKTYTAKRISVSDGILAGDGQRLILYTRIWDETQKKYDYYAVDQHGDLVKIYAYGDKIMWLDDGDVTLFWDFTVYKNSDGSETGYYEFRNTSTGEYLAPQLNGQVVSDTKIGVQMRGRKYEVKGDKTNYGEYYSPIMAWDKPNYDYATLYGDKETNKLGTDVLANGGSFYFAVLDDEVYHNEQGKLHSVETIDNNKYGITMKMIDFGGTNLNTNADQNRILGDSTKWEDHKYTAKENILSTDLKSDGYPMTSANKSLSELYDQTKLKEVNNLFIKSVHESSGYFEFDSCQNYATLLDENGNVSQAFTVYRELGTHDSKDKNTLRHGQFFPYNNISENVYDTNSAYPKAGYNLYGFGARTDDDNVDLLSDDDPRKYEKLFKITNPNYQFGMELEAKFVQTPSGLDAWGHDVIFEFTGDDDFWLYVDGELVLDLGGIHSALGGKVNFRTGEVIENETNTTLYNVFKSNYEKRLFTSEEADRRLLEDECGIYEEGAFNEIRNLEYSEFTQLYPTEYNAYKNALSETEIENYVVNSLIAGRNITVDEYIKVHHDEYLTYLAHTREQTDEYFTQLSEAAGVPFDDFVADHQPEYDNYMNGHSEKETYQYFLKQSELHPELNYSGYCKAHPDVIEDCRNSHTEAETKTHFEQLYADRKITLDEYRALNPSWDYTTKHNELLSKKHEEVSDEVNRYLQRCFEKNEDGQWVFKDYTEHTMKIFYMERGAGASNLYMHFNLSAVTPGNVLFSKQLSVNNRTVQNTTASYPFQIMWKYTDSDEEEWKYLGDTDESDNITVSYQNSTQTVKFAPSYTPASLVGYEDQYDQLPYKNVFFIVPGRYLEINFPDNAMYYQIVECAVDTSIYEGVEASGPDGGNVSLQSHAVHGNIHDLIASSKQVSEQPTIAFNNKLNAESLKSLTIEKYLYDETGQLLEYDPDNPRADVDNTTFSFRLYFYDDEAKKMVEANMHSYYITDESDYIVKWNAANKKFERYTNENHPTGVKNYDSLTENERNAILTVTSMYGAISNIPSTYKVVVPGLIAGTRFKVEERDYEIPVGYDLVEYECVRDDEAGTAGELSFDLIDTDNKDVSQGGIIKVGKQARMRVENKRGFGLEAEKNWTDADFTTYHAPIYMAVYVKENGVEVPVEGTLRELKSSDTSVKYFFDSLDDKNISDYQIYEVRLNNPVYENGELQSYDSFTKLEQSSTIDVAANDQDGNPVTPTPSYTVSYEVDDPTSSSPSVPDEEGNVRRETISNIRSGGLKIVLNKWSNTTTFDDDIPLGNGTFVLKSVDSQTGLSTILGTYTSDQNGLITVIYNFDKDPNYNNGEVYYRLEEISPPDNYEGLTRVISFKVKKEGNNYLFDTASWTNANDPPEGVAVDEDGDPSDGKYWAEYNITSDNQNFIAVINIYNKYIPPASGNYYFDIEKIIFVDKNIHNSDLQQKFVFKVERLKDNLTEDQMKNPALSAENIEERFFVTLNCNKEMTYTYENDSVKDVTLHWTEGILPKTEAYNYPLSLPNNSKYSFNWENQKMNVTYPNASYTFPAAIWHGQKTLHVSEKGWYRISEVNWSNTDYDFWTNSNLYKGNKSNDKQTNKIIDGGIDRYVIFSTEKVEAQNYKDPVYQGSYRPTASFTNSETEYAYLSSQAWAENILKLK